MAFDADGSRFLLYAKSRGVDFSRTAMIGRHRLFLDPQVRESLADVLARNLADFGYQNVDISSLLREANGYAEPFLRLLGCTEACSFDASPYEQATYIHDFNLPIHPQFHGRFTAVLDGGTLEHIFNFPVAIRNCMEMLAVGGYFLGITPANNACGHGFYQFSPELYFRVFSEENGFRIDRILACETKRTGKNSWFVVADPLQLREMVTLVNRRETYLLVIAQRTGREAIFAKPAQQSIYTEVMWKADGRPGPAEATSRPRRPLRQYVPGPLKMPVRIARRAVRQAAGVYRRFFFPFDPRYFTRLDEGENRWQISADGCKGCNRS